MCQALPEVIGIWYAEKKANTFLILEDSHSEGKRSTKNSNTVMLKELIPINSILSQLRNKKSICM